jgi:hypothetical protein
MHEFNNRIAAQRQILQLVNRKPWEKEELFGLSRKAIQRWISVNRIEPESRLVQLIMTASEKLFFLANKSQEQISDKYLIASKEIAAIARLIEMQVG